MRIVMMGTGGFAVPTFSWLLDSGHEVPMLFTRPARTVHGRRKTPANPMRQLAEQHGVPVSAPESVNSGEPIAELAQLHADLLIVCDYGQILSPKALAVAPLGGINLHASVLPKYRGAAPINWAIYHGERETGVTVIHMTPRLDAGPCLISSRVAIGKTEDAVELECRLAEIGVQAVSEAITLLDSWDRESVLGTVQDASQATKAPRLKKADGVVDWTRSAEQISCQVRAFKPWPGTYTEWHGAGRQPLRLILEQAAVAETTHPTAEPGTVVDGPSGKLMVAAGSGTLELLQVQPAGKRVLSAAEFLRGYPLVAGERVGMNP